MANAIFNAAQKCSDACLDRFSVGTYIMVSRGRFETPLDMSKRACVSVALHGGRQLSHTFVATQCGCKMSCICEGAFSTYFNSEMMVVYRCCFRKHHAWLVTWTVCFHYHYSKSYEGLE